MPIFLFPGTDDGTGQIFVALPGGSGVCALSLAPHGLFRNWIVYSHYSRRSWDLALAGASVLHSLIPPGLGWVKNTPAKSGIYRIAQERPQLPV